MVKKLLLIICTIICLLCFSNIKTKSLVLDIDTTSNYFGKKENKEKVEEITIDDLLIKINPSYEKIEENNQLILFLNKKTLGICLYDKLANYAWYSSYQHLDKLSVEAGVKSNIESGVIITAYDTTTLNEVRSYCSNEKECKIEYKKINNGFLASLNYITLGISFDIEVIINNNDLLCKVLLDTLKEVPYKTAAMKVAKEYKLKDVEIFPYMGSDNYLINAYAVIPDGNGALIRYTDTSYDTAYIKQIYGVDNGTIQKNKSNYLKNNYDITLPIFGINHGYNQAAFLCQITSGEESSELHSYPYMYSNLALNRTFFKFLARNKINIDVASSESGIITIINNNVVNNLFELKYSFINNNNANYSGIAKEYQEDLNLKQNKKDTNNINIKLDTLAQDYKKSLFGKKYIELTSYKELTNILEELNKESVNNILVNYLGFNRNGYFDNTLTKVKLDRSLGSKKDYQVLIDYLNKNNYELYFYTNPLVATRNVISKETIKTLNLKLFEYDFKSSNNNLKGRYINPLKLANYFLKNQKNYQKLEINNFSLDTIGTTCISYRYKTNEYSRDIFIDQIINELDKITKENNNYNLAMENPYSYYYQFIKNIYNTPVESSKYSFITDSIPLMSLLLTSYIDLYSNNINYVSNYDLYYLRLIEYHIYPSFIITYEDTNKLRFCNYEYLYTTKYNDWKEEIKRAYSIVNKGLKNTINAKMISHRYIDNGICEIIYDNNVTIYINYTNEDYSYNNIIIPKCNFSILGGMINEE